MIIPERPTKIEPVIVEVSASLDSSSKLIGFDMFCNTNADIKHIIAILQFMGVTIHINDTDRR